MIIDLTKLSHADLEQLATDLSEEQARRRDLREVEALVWRHVNTGGAPVETLTAAAAGLGLEPAAMVSGAEQALPDTEDGAEWVQPVGAHDAYREGAVVTRGGKAWVNLTPFNVWEPPIGWREQVEEGYPEFVPPTGAHDAYASGDRVTFQGAVYESTIDGNVYSPADYPAGWKLIEGEQ